MSKLTTQRLEAGLHEVRYGGRKTALQISRSHEPGKALGWRIDDGRLDYLDRCGEPHTTLEAALDWLRWRISMEEDPAGLLSCEEEVQR